MRTPPPKGNHSVGRGFLSTKRIGSNLMRGMRANVTIYLREKSGGAKTENGVVSVGEVDQKVPGSARKEFEKATRLRFSRAVTGSSERRSGMK